MSFFLKKSNPRSKGLYLQIYEGYYVPGKGTRNRSFKKIGYVSDLIKQGILDPISHFQKEVDKLNEQDVSSKSLKISDKPKCKNIGYFLVKNMLDLLGMDYDLDCVGLNYECRFRFSDLFRNLCYAQILSPGSKYKAFENVLPEIYDANEYSYDQILDFVEFLGSDYHKYIEVLNKHISNLWKRNLDKVYFDCTNYYFEIDLENDFLKKGPSKEKRNEPLLAQALMLDANQIPLDTTFFPGNESERPYLRSRIEDMKNRNNVKGRVIQVADKGLNCARNIYAAVVEAKDGYIFSKSLKGTSLSDTQKRIILDNSPWTTILDNNGNLAYRYKVLQGYENGKTLNYIFSKYHCRLNPDDEKETEFTVKEKRILTYNPSLAAKQKAEIKKEVEKLQKALGVKTISREEFGDAVKYLNIEAKDKDGKTVKIASSINYDKVDEDLMFAGYNLLVTSEIDAHPNDIYKIYHNLWRIEECFRILKTQLEARPVYLQKKESIYGHFLICYFSLTLMRLLELKIFNDEIPVNKLFEFIRKYKVTEARDGSFINCATPNETLNKIRDKLGLLKLDNAYLTKRDIDFFMSDCFWVS